MAETSQHRSKISTRVAIRTGRHVNDPAKRGKVEEIRGCADSDPVTADTLARTRPAATAWSSTLQREFPSVPVQGTPGELFSAEQPARDFEQ
jgi:hypothetical protein